MVDIRFARTASERQEIFRFRYQIYVLEQHRLQHYADHDRQQIAEPLDTKAALLGAWRGDSLVGTLRINLSRDGSLGSYESLYSMVRAGRFHPGRTAIATKFMVHPSERGHAVALRLCLAAFSYGMARDVAFSFIDCNPASPRVIEFFEALGYVRLPGTIDHMEYGPAVPLVLCLADRDHLNAIGSPFRKFLIPIDPDVVDLHRRTFAIQQVAKRRLTATEAAGLAGISA